MLDTATLNQLLANGKATAELVNRSGGEETRDHVPVCLITIEGTGIAWALTEADPEYPDRLFGLCDLGMGFPEIGYVSLWELTRTLKQVPLKVDTETLTQPLSFYQRMAQVRGGLVHALQPHPGDCITVQGAVGG